MIVQIAIGGPRLSGFEFETINSDTTLTVTKSAFANRGIIVSNMPASAQVTDVEIKFSGTSMSNIPYLRYRHSSTSTWTQGPDFTWNHVVPYTYESPSNKYANGTWYVSYKAASYVNTSLTITPGIRLTYVYELGD